MKELENLKNDLKEVADIIRPNEEKDADIVPLPELKPCPFCGSEDVDAKDGSKVVGVECKECHALMMGFVGNGAKLMEMVEKWNRRDG